MILYTPKYNIPFQIDEDDFEMVSYYSWHIVNGYAHTMAGRQPNQYRIKLHRLLLGAPPEGLEWDHKNQDKLDNRRDNFRLATRSIQTRNTPLQCNNTSGVRGVHKIGTKWSVRIGDGFGERIVIGRFTSLEEAFEARLDAEEVFWGANR